MERVSAKQAQGILESLIEDAAAHVKATQETLYILSVPGLPESIREGMAEPLDACSETLDW